MEAATASRSSGIVLAASLSQARPGGLLGGIVVACSGPGVRLPVPSSPPPTTRAFPVPSSPAPTTRPCDVDVPSSDARRRRHSINTASLRGGRFECGRVEGGRIEGSASAVASKAGATKAAAWRRHRGGRRAGPSCRSALSCGPRLGHTLHGRARHLVHGRHFMVVASSWSSHVCRCVGLRPIASI